MAHVMADQPGCRRRYPRLNSAFQRSRRRPETHDVQLFIVHLGATGEAGIGLPQYSKDQYPETYLLWGRGDLDHKVRGDWQVPYVWIGDGSKYAGPASYAVHFQAVVAS